LHEVDSDRSESHTHPKAAHRHEQQTVGPPGFEIAGVGTQHTDNFGVEIRLRRAGRRRNLERCLEFHGDLQIKGSAPLRRDEPVQTMYVQISTLFRATKLDAIFDFYPVWIRQILHRQASPFVVLTGHEIPSGRGVCGDFSGCQTGALP
jgi:hypothetical protein